MEWVQGLTYLAFDWDDRKHALVSHYYATGNAQSQDGFPMDPSLQLAGHPMADMMENIPRQENAGQLAGACDLDLLQRLSAYCWAKLGLCLLACAARATSTHVQQRLCKLVMSQERLSANSCQCKL